MNIYDIAKEAGVSITTVSRVLNKKGYVSEKTKEKVQKVLDKYEYYPSEIARGLVCGTTKTIAIVVVDIRVPHYALTSYIMEQKLSQFGYMTVVCNTGNEEDECRRYLRMLSKRNIDGIILVGSIFNHLCDSETLDLLEKIPIVMANGKIDRPNIYSVIVDEMLGVMLATKHLWEQGKRKLAYVKDRDTEAGQRKVEGFIKQMSKLGYHNVKKDVYHIEYGLEGGARIAKKLWEDGYDGVVFGEDLTAVGAMNYWVKNGISIPKEIALTGYNNSEYSYICNPKLTTMNNKGELLSEKVVDVLLQVMSGQTEVKVDIIQPELIKRETS